MRRNTFLLAIGLLMIGQLGFASEESDKLREQLAVAKEQTEELEAPVFMNLKEIGLFFDCLSLKDGKKRFAPIEDAARDQLKAAGLVIAADKAGGFRDVNKPYLNIRLQTEHPDEIEVLVELTEQVSLKRNRKATVILPTWSRRQILVLSKDSDPEKQAMSLVQNIVGEFTSQYVANTFKKANK